MTDSAEVWAIIPAAGAGRRAASAQANAQVNAQAKQYLDLLGKPVLAQSIERLLAVDEVQGIVVVQPAGETWRYSGDALKGREILYCDGGSDRYYSVLNGLACLIENLPESIIKDARVLVHDAARPCVRVTDIEKLLEQTRDLPGGGLLAMPLADTLKAAHTVQDSSLRVVATVPRESLWTAQTPQVFPLESLQRALLSALDRGFSVTDEASALELAGYNPLLVQGSADNLKITWPGDLHLAACILRAQSFAQ